MRLQKGTPRKEERVNADDGRMLIEKGHEKNMSTVF